MKQCCNNRVNKRIYGKRKYQNMDNTKIGKERGNSYQKMKRSPDEKHT